MKSQHYKLGLALSGGGFRASFFHIGVLAQLAELDLLRPVEVLSCVSGGSIIGAAYYCRLKKLLESRPDRKITKADYIDLVRRLEADFLRGVETNIRTRGFSNFWKNWKMFRPSYSRSDRLAELYDETFYAPVIGHPRVLISELKVQPPQAPSPFHPRKHNRSRLAKVPMLILNATSLNTGKNWQFTAVDMGEREPEKEFASFERGWILTPLRYDAKTVPDEKYRKMPLGVAVAASACVPGIFHPLPMTDMYPEVVPELVDGGVHDNQGLSSILYEECSDVIISDASEQLAELKTPGTGIASVVKRANGILMARVRQQGLESLPMLTENGHIRSSTLLHLREGIQATRTAPGESRREYVEGDEKTTPFGITAGVQRRLSELRTDLDSFTETEAYSLMYSGYRIAGHRLGKDLVHALAPRHPGLRKLEPTESGWHFSAAAPFASGKLKDPDYLRQLGVSGRTFFKAYTLMPWLIPLGLLIVLLSALLPAAILAAVWIFVFAASMETLGWYALALAAVLVLSVLSGLPFLRQLWIHNLLRYAADAAIATFGSLLAYLHLRWIDPIFLRRGRMESPVK